MSKVSERRVLEGGLYTCLDADISAKSSVTDFNGDTIDCRKLSALSFTVKWTADSGATRVGRFKLQTTDDPAAVSDPTNATWKDRTFPSGSTDGDATVSGTTASITNTAGSEQFSFIDLPAYARMIWDNTTAGTDGAITIWVSGKPE